MFAVNDIQVSGIRRHKQGHSCMLAMKTSYEYLGWGYARHKWNKMNFVCLYF